MFSTFNRIAAAGLPLKFSTEGYQATGFPRKRLSKNPAVSAFWYVEPRAWCVGRTILHQITDGITRIIHGNTTVKNRCGRYGNHDADADYKRLWSDTGPSMFSLGNIFCPTYLAGNMQPSACSKFSVRAEAAWSAPRKPRQPPSRPKQHRLSVSQWVTPPCSSVLCTLLSPDQYMQGSALWRCLFTETWPPGGLYPCRQPNVSQTPEPWASALVSAEQYVDHKDSYDRTPLSYAAENGREAVVRILLEQACVEVDCEDTEGRTPMSYASSSGNVEVAKLLMGRKDVNINSKDHDSRTPLRWAVSTEQHAIVMLLLERGDLQICPRDHYGRTPLMECARRGFEHIARTLLQKGGYQIYAKDIYGDVAFHQAVKSGNEKIVMLLLARDKNQLNAKGSCGKTALIYAAQGGHMAIVELLLEKDGILINESSEFQRKTAVMYAATYGHETIVKILLQRDEIQVNKRDGHNRSALELAALSRRKSIVRLLLQRKDVDLYMTRYTLMYCSQEILKLIEQAKDGRHEGHSWRDEPYEVPFF